MCLVLATGGFIAASSSAEDVFRFGVDRASLAWSPPTTGIVEGYAVVVSTNGGPERYAAYVTEPRVTLGGEFGSHIVARVYAIGRGAPGDPLVASAPSLPSPRIYFLRGFVSTPVRGLVLHCIPCATLELRALAHPPASFVVPAPAAPWRLVAVDRFHEAWVESLWQHEETGALVVLPFSPAAQAPTAIAAGSLADRRAVGTAEIDGDPTREIVVHRPSQSRLEFWKVVGEAITLAGGVSAPTGWTFVKAADFDGDGISDIWWQTQIPGRVEVRKVSLGQRLDVLARVDTPAPGKLVEVADFDGDALLDGLWRDDTGHLTITRLQPGGGGHLGSLLEVVSLPWQAGDEALQVRAASPLDSRPGAEIVVQENASSRVLAIFTYGQGTPLRVVLFDPAERADVVGVR